MKFDSNQAWKQAAAQVSANRDVLLALAGVFFLLPSLAVSLLLPQPQPAAGATPEQMVEQAMTAYTSALPFVIPLLLLQALGVLAMLTLFTDRRRPTVGESIKLALTGIVPYVLAQLLLGLAIGLIASALGVIAAVTQSIALVAAMVVVIALVAIWLVVRTSLTAPVIAVEHVRNPLTALQRSWLLTKGNSLRLALFYLLVGIVFLVVIAVVMAIIGILLALVASEGVATTVAAVVSAAMGAAMTVYLIAIIAAVHRQLAGPSAEAVGATFE